MRRLAHVVGAGAAATFPLYLQLRDVLVLAGLFTSLFAVSRALATIFVAAAGGWEPLKVVDVAAILAIIEGSLGYGLDNLLLPLAAAVLGQMVLGL